LVNVKTAISMPEHLLARIEEIAAEDGSTRSGVIARAVEAYVRRDRSRRITEQLDKVYGVGADEETAAVTRGHRARLGKRLKGTW
jgi:metal-responsive CopG/Arc/MetJ family transcriptional regulator